MQVWTVGHSNRTGEDFLHLLQAHRIEAVADVRRFPGSRKHPQFASEALAASLQAHGIAYGWLPKLGGRRHLPAGPARTAWRNRSFEAYAEHLRSEEFAQGLAELLHMAAACRTAMMCSELLWWRCHRSLVSDALRVSGIEVIHILGLDKTTPHPWTSPARVVDGALNYGEPAVEGEGGKSF